MRLPQTLALSLVALLAGYAALAADEHSSNVENFGTVRIFFINQFLPDPPLTTEREAISEDFGGMVSTKMRFEVAELFLNDKFVGNAMLRHVDVTPTLNLSPGDHKFRIECDGYRKFEKELTVLQYGSTHWLVIRLERMPKTDDPAIKLSPKLGKPSARPKTSNNTSGDD